MLTANCRLPMRLACFLFMLHGTLFVATPVSAAQPHYVSLNGSAAAGVFQIAQGLVTSGGSADSLQKYEIRIAFGPGGDQLALTSVRDGSILSSRDAMGSRIVGNITPGQAISGLDLEAFYLASRSTPYANTRDMSTLRYVIISWPTDVEVGVRYVDFATNDPPLTIEDGKTIFHCNTEFGFVVILATRQVTKKPVMC